MVQQISLAIVLLIVLNTIAGCTEGNFTTASTQANCLEKPITATDVLTQHNNAARTGANLTETQLTPECVSTHFGQKYPPIKLRGQVIAQPLYVSEVPINGIPKKVLYVVTRENRVYALDPDTGSSVWKNAWVGMQDTTTHERAEALPGMDDGPKVDKVIGPCLQTHGPVGITSTPVIDLDTYTMYLVFRVGLPPDKAFDDKYADSLNQDIQQRHQAQPEKDPLYLQDQDSAKLAIKQKYMVDAHYWLAAIDIRDGSLKTQVEVKYTGFDANMQLNRPGLLLLNHVVYVAFGAAVCDSGGNPWISKETKAKQHQVPHGWVFAYQTTFGLPLLAAFNTTSDPSSSGGGGIWQSGNGLTGDPAGNVYAMTGNSGTGTPGDEENPGKYGESFLKLKLSGAFAFSPSSFTIKGEDQKHLDLGDADLGSGGPVLLNGNLIGGGKQGKLYVFNTSDIKQPKQQFQAFYNTWDLNVDPCDYDKIQAYGPNIHGAPIVWKPANTKYSFLYDMPEKDYLKAFKVDNAAGTIDEHPFMSTMTTTSTSVTSPRGMPGGFLSLSANGDHDGIIWASVADQSTDGGTDASTTDGSTIKGRLMAFDALTLKLLWQGEDEPFMKFVPPTVADGKVFRVIYNQAEVNKGDSHATEDGDTIVVYGLGGKSSPVNVTQVQSRIQPVTAAWRTPDPGQPNSHLDLFTVGNDGAVLHTYWGSPLSTYEPDSGKANLLNGKCGIDNTANWRGWERISPPGTAAPGQAVTALWSNSHHLDVFATSTDGTVVSTFWEDVGYWLNVQGWNPQKNPVGWAGAKWIDGKGWMPNWFPIGRSGITKPGQPITAVWRTPAPGQANSRLDLFLTGTDGSILQATWQGASSWSDWQTVPGATGMALVGQPITAVWSNTNHLDLFTVRDDKTPTNDGTVMSTFWEEGRGWLTNWFPIGSSGTTRPGQPITALWRLPASGQPNSRLDLFLTNKEGTIRQATWQDPGKGWSDWQDVPGLTGKALPGQRVTAIWSNPNHLDLFTVRDDKTPTNDGTVMSTFWEEGKGWLTTGWFAVGEPHFVLAGQPVEAGWSNKDHLDLFTTDNDGIARGTFWEFAGGWRSWFGI
jgi:hypothetical protein